MRKFLLGLISLLGIAALQAQITAVNVQADSTRLLIGSQLHVTFSAQAPQSTVIFMPKWEETLGKWEVLHVDTLLEDKKDGFHTFYQTLTLVAWDSGTYTIPPVAFSSVYGQTQDSTFSQPLSIQVMTVEVDTTQAIKPIKAPFAASFMWQETLPYLLGIAAILVMIGLYFVFRKKKKVGPVSPEIALTYKQIAIEQIRKLEAEKLWEKGELKLHYVKLTDILRTYLDQTYHTAAFITTSRELLGQLQPFLPTESHAALKIYLEMDTQVKFAKYVPDTEMCLNDNARICQWIQQHPN